MLITARRERNFMLLKLLEGQSYVGDNLTVLAGSEPVEVDLKKLDTQTLKQLIWMGNNRVVFDLSITDLNTIELEFCSR